MTSTADDGFRFRSIALPALIPTLLFGIGEGAVIPIIPAVAASLGADLAGAALIAAMIVVGQLAGDIPAGWLVSKIGERRAMIGAAVLSLVGVGIAIVALQAAVFGLAVFLIGLSAATFALARQAFMTTYVPVRIRARALSTLGGAFRAGWFVGPFLGAVVIAWTGTVEAVFFVHVTCAVAVLVILLVMRDPTEGLQRPDAGGREVAAEAHGLFRTVWLYRGVLLRMGTGAGVVGALRASRLAILPLWAVSIGLSEQTTAVVIGIGAAADFALFYTSGQIMDRFGRLWSVVPSMLGMSIALLTLSVTHDLGSAVQWFVVIAVFLGVANGIGSGIIMTLSADLAPRENPAPFLGAFRFTADAGAAVAPLVVAGVVAVASLSLATALVGVVGLAGVGILWRNIPRYVPHRRAGGGAVGEQPAAGGTG
ncbi:MFS transporter [Herbiconiux sp. KACC 21604]|uniref:MFS transporter n=1 Tax=unclassified Herbiconiux TaxID=2618217 RepID=UPI001491CE7A|nr:MFS transporter [Herbiconiux sp. SALV-R1]QJU53839.1 MFS transporter [Herbiconiux sp. SALV-R1]WPO84851.1 MFS transporter [Herbiconiux sp. KACC 21604]